MEAVAQRAGRGASEVEAKQNQLKIVFKKGPLMST
jgi:hypothetical protein